jgi:hypothetical protein
VSANSRLGQRPGPITVRRSAGGQTGSFRLAIRSLSGAWRDRAKNTTASARNLWASRAASPEPASRRTGDPADIDTRDAPAPDLRAKPVARASALHNRKSNRHRTAAQRRTTLSAMVARVIMTTARRRSASLSLTSFACQCITAAQFPGSYDNARHKSMSRTIFPIIYLTYHA